MTERFSSRFAVTADSLSSDSVFLDSAARRLTSEFGHDLGAESVERLLESSYRTMMETGATERELARLSELFAHDRLTALRKSRGGRADGPMVLFVCTHNAGRSQMALGFFASLTGGRAVGWSAGSTPGTEINPAVVRVMAERGIDIAAAFPKPWTDELVWAADVVIDMGCGDSDPIVSGHRFEQWWLPDPKDRELDEVRAIRDQVEARVRRLVSDLGL